MLVLLGLHYYIIVVIFESMSLPTLFFFRIAFAIPEILHYRMNFGISLLISFKKSDVHQIAFTMNL
jgi:hypothetical protein